MIKVITERDLPWPHKASIDELLVHQKHFSTVELDLETTGLNAFKHRPTAVQIGIGGIAYVIDTYGLDWDCLKFLEHKCCLGHNIKFDLVFLMQHGGIFINKVYDTYIAELLLTNGKSTARNLGAVVKRYTGISLDKSAQKNIHLLGLKTAKNIEYSGNDVLHIISVAKEQIPKVKRAGLTQVCKDEMATLPAFAYMEYSGFTLDTDKWKNVYELSAETALDRRIELDKLAIDSAPILENLQNNLFSPVPETTVNWNSPQQAHWAFIQAGILEEEDSMEKAELKKHNHPVINAYIDYKESKKKEGTYGGKFLRHVESDGKIHTKIKQIVKTGRTSSAPNLQNIPKIKEFRSCFVPKEGNKLIVCDYSGQESVILADVSQEEKLLDFYLSGGADLHSFTAQLIWFDELGELTLEEISENHKDKRQKAKSATFAISYGGNGRTIANNLNITPKEGDRIFKGFMDVFGGLKDYFDYKYEETIDLGYILINKKSGRKLYFDFWDKFMRLYNIINAPGFWADYHAEKRNDSSYYNKELLPMRQRYNKWDHVVKKATMNAPIQGTAADQKKLALTTFWRWIRREGLIDTVYTPIEVHDEIVAECPNHMVDIVTSKLQSCMEDAGNHYLQTLKIKAEPVVLDCWWEEKQ